MPLPERLEHLKIFIPQPLPPVPRADNRKSEWVYVVGCHEFVKIGIAWNVPARMATMQTGCPYDLVFIGAWRSGNAVEEEEAMHAHLEQYRVRGEWFKLPKAMMDRLCMKPSDTKAALI